MSKWMVPSKSYDCAIISVNVFNPITSGDVWVRTQHCGYWCLELKHQTISIHSTDQILISLDQLLTNYLKATQLEQKLHIEKRPRYLWVNMWSGKRVWQHMFLHSFLWVMSTSGNLKHIKATISQTKFQIHFFLGNFVFWLILSYRSNWQYSALPIYRGLFSPNNSP